MAACLFSIQSLKTKSGVKARFSWPDLKRGFQELVRVCFVYLGLVRLSIGLFLVEDLHNHQMLS